MEMVGAKLRLMACLLGACFTFSLGQPAAAQQGADPDFKSAVEVPAYRQNHPLVVIDEAHSNFHTAGGRYKPFADLLTSDGYNVRPGTKKFTPEMLAGVRVLVISNALAEDAGEDDSSSAFTAQECDTVRDWVRRGGALLLIADHTPFGSAAEMMSKRFGVDMGKGFVFDPANSDGTNPSVLVFSVENKLLGQHQLLRRGRSKQEVRRVVSFTGQSLGIPPGAVPLLKLGDSAYESPTRKEAEAALKMDANGKATATREQIAAHAKSVAGRAQGLAIQFGRGRLVVLGEAAMFSAQVIRYRDGDQQKEFKMGMNVSGNDDRQFALNVMHWLSGLFK
jgi:hypothetical protein